MDLSQLNGFEWKLNLNAAVKCHVQKRLIIGELNKQCAVSMKNRSDDDVKCSSEQALFDLIQQTITSTNNNFGILCKTHVDVINGDFPSDKGLKCIIFFKSSKISNVNRSKKTNETIEKKIKYKLMFDDDDWHRNKEIKMKLQLLSYQLSRLIITKKKIVIGRTWNGAWYVPKKRLLQQKQCIITFNGLQEPTEQLISKHELYVKYITDKPLESMEHIRKASNIQMIEGQCDIPIGAFTFSNLFTNEVGQSLATSLYVFMTSPKEYLEKYGKVEYNKSMNRIKFWCGSCFYYYQSTADKEHLGDCFPLAMEVANGVRLNEGYLLPQPIQQIQAGLLEGGIIEEQTDAVAMNLYYAEEDKAVSSGIGEHNEGDRFSDLIHCTFTSRHPSANTVLSINQPKSHGTAEVEIPSVHLEIVRFDS